MKNTYPKFCFICGKPIEEIGLGYYQCIGDACSEVFLAFKDEDDNQNIIHVDQEPK